MRLKPDKIDKLANLVYAELEANPEVKFGESRPKVVGLIKAIITDDMRAEDEIEEEARKLLEQHRGEINRKDVSFDKLLIKLKAKLAQDRKMVL